MMIDGIKQLPAQSPIFTKRTGKSYETLGFMGLSWDLAHHHLEKMSRIHAYLGEATGEKDENWMKFEVCCKQWGWKTSKIERLNWDLAINMLVALQLNILPLFWEIIVCSPASKKEKMQGLELVSTNRVDQGATWEIGAIRFSRKLGDKVGDKPSYQLSILGIFWLLQATNFPCFSQDYDKIHQNSWNPQHVPLWSLNEPHDVSDSGTVLSHDWEHHFSERAWFLRATRSRGDCFRLATWKELSKLTTLGHIPWTCPQISLIL